MPDILNEETIYVCADAMFNILADAVREKHVRKRLLTALEKHSLGETPYLEVNALFKSMAEKCLAIRTATAAGAAS